MAYAEYLDVAARSFEDIAEYEDVIETRLQDAELILKSKISDLDTRVTAGTIDPETVTYVEVEMILRLLRNPEGYMQESDGNYSYMLSQQLASGKLEVATEEWSLLGVQRGAFTIRPLL